VAGLKKRDSVQVIISRRAMYSSCCNLRASASSRRPLHETRANARCFSMLSARMTLFSLLFSRWEPIMHDAIRQAAEDGFGGSLQVLFDGLSWKGCSSVEEASTESWAHSEASRAFPVPHHSAKCCGELVREAGARVDLQRRPARQ